MDKTAQILGTIGLVALTAAVTFLAYHGTIDGQAAIGFFTGLSVAGVVGGATHAAAKSGARAAMWQTDDGNVAPSPPTRTRVPPKP